MPRPPSGGAEYEGATGFKFPTDTPFFYVEQLLSFYASMEPTAMVSRKDLQSELHCDMIQNMAQTVKYEEKIAKIRSACTSPLTQICKRTATVR